MPDWLWALLGPAWSPPSLPDPEGGVADGLAAPAQACGPCPASQQHPLSDRLLAPAPADLQLHRPWQLPGPVPGCRFRYVH